MKVTIEIPDAINPVDLYPQGVARLQEVQASLQPGERFPYEYISNPDGSQAYMELGINAYKRIQALGELAGGREIVSSERDEGEWNRTKIHYRSGVLALGAAAGDEAMGGHANDNLFARTVERVDDVTHSRVKPGRKAARERYTEQEVMDYSVELYRGTTWGTSQLVRTAQPGKFNYWHYDMERYQNFKEGPYTLKLVTLEDFGMMVDLLDTISMVEDRAVGEMVKQRGVWVKTIDSSLTS